MGFRVCRWDVFSGFNFCHVGKILCMIWCGIFVDSRVNRVLLLDWLYLGIRQINQSRRKRKCIKQRIVPFAMAIWPHKSPVNWFVRPVNSVISIRRSTLCKSTMPPWRNLRQHLLGPNSPEVGATTGQAFLSIDGIDGNQGSGHEKWIEIFEWNLGESNPHSTVIGGAVPARSPFDDMVIVKQLIRRPSWLRACAGGNPHREVLIDCMTIRNKTSGLQAKCMHVLITRVISIGYARGNDLSLWRKSSSSSSGLSGNTDPSNRCSPDASISRGGFENKHSVWVSMQEGKYSNLFGNRWIISYVSGCSSLILR